MQGREGSGRAGEPTDRGVRHVAFIGDSSRRKPVLSAKERRYDGGLHENALRRVRMEGGLTPSSSGSVGSSEWLLSFFACKGTAECGKVQGLGPPAPVRVFCQCLGRPDRAKAGRPAFSALVYFYLQAQSRIV